MGARVKSRFKECASWLRASAGDMGELSRFLPICCLSLVCLKTMGTRKESGTWPFYNLRAVFVLGDSEVNYP